MSPDPHTGTAPTDTLERCIEVTRGWLGSERPRVGVILGSGLSGLTRSMPHPRVLPFEGIPGFPPATIRGHAGEFVVGELEGVSSILQCGRFHLYEGHAATVVVRPVRVMLALGVEVLIVTNAAGGISTGLRPPCLLLLADQIDFTFRNPLVGPVLRGEPRFPRVVAPFDGALRELARGVASSRGVMIDEGVYAGVAGPSYETPAEIRMLRRLGADAVGMSTVHEVLIARSRGARVLGLSAITNWAAGLTPSALSHDDVLTAARSLAGQLEAVVRGTIELIGPSLAPAGYLQ